VTLVAALAFTGHDAEAREALQRYLALPSTGPMKTIAAWKAYYSAQGAVQPASTQRADVRRPAQGGVRRMNAPPLGAKLTTILAVSTRMASVG